MDVDNRKGPDATSLSVPAACLAVSDARTQLIERAVATDDMDVISDACADFLMNPVTVITSSFSIVTHSKAHEVPDPIWRNAVDRGYITLEFAATLNNWDDLTDPVRGDRLERITVDQISRWRRRFFKMSYQGHLMGYLNVAECETALDDHADADYALVASILAKEISVRRTSSVGADEGRREDVVLSLINGEYVDRLHFLEMIRGTELDRSADYLVACLNVHDLLSFNAGPDTFKDQLLSFFPGAVIVVESGVLTILFDRSSHPEVDVEGDARLSTYLDAHGLVLGISDTFSELFSLKDHQRQALFALSRADADRRQGNLARYEDVKLLDLIDHIPASEREGYCSRGVRDMAHYDAAHHTWYLETFYQVLSCGGNASEAACALCVHRNTVRYRLERIQELFGLDPHDAHMVAGHLLSCMIMRSEAYSCRTGLYSASNTSTTPMAQSRSIT
ncbi:MAG: helix-turn-helix domain-containing protein [Atopobiaceae bacterium]|jgi:hypothetical protein|nr:helix-turn-helix domain-containing protein [Atopobiaceae bacterium]MCI2172740.1 helix-turn-helix domain-containing protein [Atopobiaceae bacterium]MCI2207047.1 helix-turn-helix domain-containing protein [Atopobiaceae bacterium]